MKIGIAGAGLLGRLLALKLSQLDDDITLFDKDDCSGTNSCGYIAAGMLSPYAEMETSETTLFDIGINALADWANILMLLDKPVYFKHEGSVVVAHPQDQAELSRFTSLVTNKTNIRLHTETTAMLEPGLSKFKTCVYLPHEGHIATDELFLALHDTLKGKVTWHTEHTVTDINDKKLTANGKDFVFDWIIDCRGFGSTSDLKGLRGIRGELIWLHAPEVNISRPVRLMHPRYRLYIVPRPNQHYIVGATEIESEDRGDITVRSALELLSAAYSTHSGFAEARILKTATNCRPAFTDNLPRIQKNNHCISANGLYRHGYLLAPAMTDEIVRCIKQQPQQHEALWQTQ